MRTIDSRSAWIVWCRACLVHDEMKRNISTAVLLPYVVQAKFDTQQYFPEVLLYKGAVWGSTLVRGSI